MKTFGEAVVPMRSFAEFRLQLTQDEPRGWRTLSTVRVYELNLAFGAERDDLTAAELEILRDALIDLRYDAAREIMRGLAGQWRPSTAVISLVSLGAQRILLDRTTAASAWSIDLDVDAPPNESYGLAIFNTSSIDVPFRAEALFKIRR